MPNTTPINTVRVEFFNDFLKNILNTYFLPFVSFIQNPTAWGYEIEGIKYSTHDKFPVLACVFCHSNKSQFVDKTLRFYVECGNNTYYSSEYSINSNGTLTEIKN
jgi:hypothetical protein